MPTVNKKTVAGTSGIVATIVAAIFAVEGGFTDDKNDRGNWTTGVIGQGQLNGTNHGISAMAYPDLDIKSLTQEQATALYIKDYINKPGFDHILPLSPTVAHKLVDAGVNVGSARPSRWFQAGLNSLSRNGTDFPQINVDGKVGPGTAKTYAALQSKRGKVTACELTIKLLDAQQAVYYMSLTNLSIYTPGWIANRVGNVPLSDCKKEG